MPCVTPDETICGNTGQSGGSDTLSGVVYSDDDSDLSISDIDEAVLASEFSPVCVVHL